MKPIREVVSRDVIEDLWGAGYTILPRARHPDPFHVPPELVPQGRSYQWWHLVHDKIHFDRHGDASSGWAAVLASRHDGYFMPAGHIGNIEVQGLGLFEKSKYEVDQELNQNAVKAHQQVADWITKAGADGLSGSVSVGGISSDVGGDGVVKDHLTKTIETRVRLPQELMPYMSEIFAERDRLVVEQYEAYSLGTMTKQQEDIYKRYDEAAKADPEVLKGPTLNALWMPIAIENVRKSLVTPYQPPQE